MDTSVLIVAQEESVLAAALVAPRGVDTHVLTAAVVQHTLVHV